MRAATKIHQQCDIAGLFVVDRELLNCAHCGLLEDVLIDGRLVTYQAGTMDAADSGLRFAAAEDGNFVCPQCGAPCQVRNVADSRSIVRKLKS